MRIDIVMVKAGVRIDIVMGNAMTTVDLGVRVGEIRPFVGEIEFRA